MGRRSLRPVDPRIDLSANLKSFEELPRPCTSETLFGRAAPLEVEVGSGKGLFLQSAAAATPDVNFLGIEIAPRYARYAAAGLARQGLTNAIVVAGDGLRVFHELVPDASLSAVHVYFPDPWWKSRHHKRRVMKEAFLLDVERTLLPGGVLHFWTDVKEYFRQTLVLIAATTKLVGPREVQQQPAAHDLDYRTHFERRMRQHNEAVFRSEYEKPQ